MHCDEAVPDEIPNDVTEKKTDIKPQWKAFLNVCKCVAVWGL